MATTAGGAINAMAVVARRCCCRRLVRSISSIIISSSSSSTSTISSRGSFGRSSRWRSAGGPTLPHAARRRPLSMRVVGDAEAEAMLEHWCVGLRSVLMASGLPGPIDHDASVAALRELRASPPAAGAQLEPFWSVLYLSVAFESELLLARQSGAPPDVVLQIGQLAASCASAGLLQLSDQLLIGDWLNSQLAPAAADSAPVLPFPPAPPPVTAADVSPWTLFATPTLASHADAAVAGLSQRGFAVIDGFLGDVQAGVLATEFRAFVGDCAEASPPLLQPGELDETKRSQVCTSESAPVKTAAARFPAVACITASVSICLPCVPQPSVRGDLITWLLGSELAPQWSVERAQPFSIRQLSWLWAHH